MTPLDESPATVRPICATCTVATRTADTPHVKVRVSSCLVLRDLEGLRMVYGCHGHSGLRTLLEGTTEGDIEKMSVFPPGSL